MAKVFMCDCCGEVVKDPFAVNFREYTRMLRFENFELHNKAEIKEETIDLCQECYSNPSSVHKNIDYKKVQAAYNVLVHARDNENLDADTFGEAITDAIGYLGEVLE